MNFELKGKVAIVTGARTGIGHAAAVSLARSGADIVGVGSSPMPDVKTEMEAMGVRFLAIQADLTKPTADMFDSIVTQTLEAFGHIDILVNNAGIIRRDEVLDYSESDWDDVMNINAKSLFFLSQRVAQEFKKQGGGKIVNVASLLSHQGGIRVVAYTSSKSAVLGMTRAMCNELAKFNINVNAVVPGYVKTFNTRALQADTDRYNAILDRIPAGRWAESSDLGDPIAFLCSDAANYINGADLAVDGGWLAR